MGVNGLACVRTPDDHQRALAVIDVLLDEVGEDETHPLAEVLDYLANQVKSYEDENTVIPQAPPAEVLRFLMEQHGLTQGDLADCAPQVASSFLANPAPLLPQSVNKYTICLNKSHDQGTSRGNN